MQVIAGLATGQQAMGTKHEDNFMKSPFNSLLGSMKVYEEPLPPPKIQIRGGIQITDECRQEVNAWLLDTFGRRNSTIKPGEFLVSEKFGFIVAPHGMAGIISRGLV